MASNFDFLTPRFCNLFHFLYWLYRYYAPDGKTLPALTFGRDLIPQPKTADSDLTQQQLQTADQGECSTRRKAEPRANFSKRKATTNSKDYSVEGKLFDSKECRA